MGLFSDAKEALLKSLGYSEKYDFVGGLGNIHISLSDVSEKLGEYQDALLYHRKAKVINDSIYNEKNTNSLSKLELDFQTEKKDKEIALQQIGLKEKEAALLQSRTELLQAELRSEKTENQIKILNKTKDLQELGLISANQEILSKTLDAKAKAALLSIAKKDKALKEEEFSDQILIRNVIFAGILLAAVIGYLMFNRYRLRQQIANQQTLINQRKNLSADLHDDIGATLSSISIYTEAIKNKLKNNEHERVMELVNKIGENSRETISTLGDIVWNLNPINDSAQKLFNRMESTATLLLSAQNTILDFSVDEKLLDHDFSMEAKQNLYLIFKETINNTAKYALATEVKVSIQKNANALEMSISDNGKGFDVASKTEGNGLRNIRLRTQSLGGSFDFSSSASGTDTHINLPISEMVK
jgi:signal transduction histidine kinase